MRRHELEAGAGYGEPGPAPGDQATVASSAHRASKDARLSTCYGPGEGSDALHGATEAAGAAQPPLAQVLLDDVRALAAKLDDMRRERAQEKAEASAAAVDVSTLRAEIDAMRRSLADLAPRNAVVALEGAIRDLVGRVEMLRQGGHGEAMLAPLEAMAEEFRAAVKAHDPRAAAAGLEREIRAIG